MEGNSKVTKPGFIDIWPLSPLQKGMLFHALYEEQGADVYVIQMALDLRRALDAPGLRRAVTGVLARHDNLRASFRNRNSGQPVQAILREADPDWSETDISHLTGDERAAELARLLEEDRSRRFDLTRPPLRFSLIRLGEEEYRFVFTAHHILLDGWSMPLVLGELMTLYNNGGDTSALPPVVPYKGYLGWLAEQDRDEAERAWKRALAETGGPTLIAPPGSTMRPGAARDPDRAGLQRAVRGAGGAGPFSRADAQQRRPDGVGHGARRTDRAGRRGVRRDRLGPSARAGRLREDGRPLHQHPAGAADDRPYAPVRRPRAPASRTSRRS